MHSDIWYKDQLRKDLIEYEMLLEYINKDEIEKAAEHIQKQIDRIKSSLQD